ncbi:AAA family ATPase [Neobacillus sp. LXY-4]|uniref:ATP-binding protein n=1 Tax=Neobacillus sp. LXY-4 TaxID=3379826 RepID=UPI003EDECA11
MDELHIYGYGKLENYKVKNIDNMTIFYGENEAGKSTIMSFIHSILFGFPTKLQTELRYEPKTFTKYGGQIIVTLPSGKAVIERVKGKAAGDVKVLLEDGAQGGEELLQQILSKMDKNLYQSIFSFNLHGLQNVQQMKNADLGKFLFSTGTLGTDRLLLAENTLQKQLDSQYKPNGKKPSINEKITELKQLYQELKKAEQWNDQYWQYIEKKTELEERTQLLHQELRNIQSNTARLQEWKRFSPLLKEEQILKEEWSHIHHLEFPREGISRLDELNRDVHSYESKISSMNVRMKGLEEEVKTTVPNAELLANEMEIVTAVENLPLYEQLVQEKNQLSLELEEVRQEIVEWQQKLHLNINEDQVLTSNTSVFMKGKTADAQKNEHRLKEKKQDLDEQFHQTKQNLEELEEQLNRGSKLLLSEVERQELIAQKNLVENQASLIRELADTREQIRLLKNLQDNEVQQEKVQQRQHMIQFSVFCTFFVILAGWGFFNQQWGIFTVAGVGLFYLLFFYRKKPTSRKNQFKLELEALTGKEKMLEGQLNRLKLKSSDGLDYQLEQDKQQREQQSILKIKWEQKNEQYEQILNAYEKWEQESRQHQKILVELGKELGLPKEISLIFIHDAFLLIEKLKNLYLTLRKLSNRYELVCHEITLIEERIISLANRFLPTVPKQLHNMAFLLKQELKKQQQLQIFHQEKCKKLIEIQEEIQQYQLEKQEITKEINQLYQLADSTSENDFREKGALTARKEIVFERLKEIERQLSVSTIRLADKQAFIEMEELDLQLSLLQAEQDEAEDNLRAIQERLAEVKYQIGLLEDGGTYAELLHRYRLKHSELNEEAKGWAKSTIAKDLLYRAVEQYKNQRLPKMIEKAESYLRFLTGENYIRIHTQTEGSSLLIENRDHILYEPRELSQATSEQIYVALRLALATTLYEKYQFPIIIDDSFVNFDHIRTSKVIQLLCELPGHQILFFTCHQHLLPYFTKGKIIRMGEHDILL